MTEYSRPRKVLSRMPNSRPISRLWERCEVEPAVAGETHAPQRSAGRLERLIVSKERQFLIGRVCVPVVLTVFAAAIGAYIAYEFQKRAHEWEMHHDGSRNTEERLQNEAVGLGQEIKDLHDQAVLWETTSGDLDMLLLFQPIERRLAILRGLGERLRRTYGWDTSQLAEAQESCQGELEELEDCLAEKLTLRPLDETECAPTFEEMVCAAVTDATFLVSEVLP